MADTIEQIFALQPEGVVGGDIFPVDVNRVMQDYANTFLQDIDYMDLLEAAEDEELFRMLGVNDATAKDETVARANIAQAQTIADQRDAAQNYIDAVGEYRSSPNARNKQILDDAKQALVVLDVPRSTIESVTNRWFPEGIDASGAISDVMGPSISGALEKGIEKGSELFGLGAEGLASLVGADKALSSALLNVPKPGVTFVFDESGKKRPLITGQTSGGTQVGITDPYGIADILAGLEEGSLRLEDVIGAGAGAVKAATAYTGDDDPNKKTGVDTGVAITPEGPTPDKPKVPADTTTLNKDKGAAAGVVSPRITGEGLGAGPGPSDKTITLKPADVPTLKLPEGITLTRPDFDPTKTERIPTSVTPASTVTPADKIPSGEGGEGGGGGGGGGLPEQSGVRTVSGGPGESVDIDYLYDFARGLNQPFLTTQEEEILKDLNIYAEGGPVKKYFPGGQILSGLSDTQKGLLGAAVGGIFGGLSGSGDTQGSQGYSGGIPDLIATRDAVPNAFAMGDRRPGEAGRRYFSDVQYTPVTDATGAPAIMGGAELAAMNQAALDRQKELSELGQGLLGMYGQKLADEAAAAEAAAQKATTDTTAATTATPYERLPGQSDVSYNFMSGLTEALGREDPALAEFKANLLSPEESAVIQAATTGPMLPTLEGLNVDVADGISPQEADAVFDLLDREFYTPEQVAKFYGFTTDEILNAYRGMGGTKFAQGGNVNGYYLGGPTDGMADQIPATIDNMQPAALSDGEFVIPADVVSHLGNGNSDAGAKNLYSMMERVRKDRTGNPEQGRQIDPNKYLA